MHSNKKLISGWVSLFLAATSLLAIGFFLAPQQVDAASVIEPTCTPGTFPDELKHVCDKRELLLAKRSADQISQKSYEVALNANKLEWLKAYRSKEEAEMIPDPIILAELDEAIKDQESVIEGNIVERATAAPTGKCWDWGLHIIPCINETMAWVGVFITWVGGLALGLAVYIFDFSINLSVLQFHSFVNGLPAINIAWGIIRDFTNLSFIFILMYTAIATILDMGSVNAKKTIASIVVAALLVNFSIIFPKVIIDVSNLVALQFYRATGPAVVDEAGKATTRREIAEPLIRTLNLQANLNNLGTDPNAPDIGQSFGTIFISSVGMFIMLLGLAVAFFAGAVLFMIRAVIFLVLIPLSPLVVAAWVVPSSTIKDYAKKWTAQLFGQAFVAPTFMFMIFFAIKIVTAKNTAGQPILKTLTASSDPHKEYLTAITFFFVIAMVNMASVAAAKSGNIGSKYISKAASMGKDWTTGMLGNATKTTGGYLGRQSFGRAARALRDSNLMQNQIANSRWVPGAQSFAKSIRSGLDATANASFGGRKGGFAATLKDATATNKSLASETLRRAHLKSLNGAERNAVFNSMSEGERAALRKEDPKLFDKIKNSLNEDQRKDLRKASASALGKAKPDQMADIFNTYDSDEQKAAYKELSARSRATLEQQIGDTGREDRLGTLSDEDREKTAEALSKHEAELAIQDKKNFFKGDHKTASSEDIAENLAAFTGKSTKFLNDLPIEALKDPKVLAELNSQQIKFLARQDEGLDAEQLKHIEDKVEEKYKSLFDEGGKPKTEYKTGTPEFKEAAEVYEKKRWLQSRGEVAPWALAESKTREGGAKAASDDGGLKSSLRGGVPPSGTV